MSDKSSSIIPAGTVFMLSYGEYDDYCISGIFRAGVDIDVAAVQAEYLAEHPEQAEEYAFTTGDFVAWLRARPGFAEELDYQEWCMGEYGTVGFTLWD